MFIRLLHKSLKFIEKLSNKYFFSVLKREKYAEDMEEILEDILYEKAGKKRPVKKTKPN